MNVVLQKLRPLFWVVAIFFGLGLVVLFVISGSDRWFRSAVPVEQRLVSHDEDIRKKAQQELLGLSVDAKRHVAEKLIPLLDHQDHLIEKWAAISIALIGPPAQEAIPALLHGVSAPDNDVVQACRVALSEIGTPDPDQLPPLMQAIGDSREAVRCEAAASIAKMGPSGANAIPLLMRQVENVNPMADCMASAISDFVAVTPDAATPLIALATNPSVMIRRNAAQVMALVGAKSPPLIQAAFQGLGQENDDEVRRGMATGLDLRRTPNERGPVAPLLVVIRRSRNETVREMAIDAVKTQIVPWDDLRLAILHALHDHSAEVRFAVLQWLQEDVEPPPHYVLSDLIPLFEDDDVRIRRLALEVLERIDSRREDLLVPVARAQKDSDPQIRCLAAEQLVEMHAADRVDVALLARDLKNDDVGSCAGDALGLAGHFNGDVVPALIHLLDDKDRETRRRAALVLMQLGSRAREALPALLQAQKDQVPAASNAVHVLRAVLARETRTHHHS